MKDMVTVRFLISSSLFLLGKNDVLEFYKNDEYLKGRTSIYQYMEDTQPIWDWTWDRCPFNQSQRILEIGCGFGEFWQSQEHKLPENCHYILTDISSGMLEICKKNTYSLSQKSIVDYHVVDAESLPYSEAFFDRVHCFFVLYYTQNPLLVLQEIKRVLRPGGLAAIYLLHSSSNERLYEIANEIHPLFPPKDIMLEQCCEKNIEELLSMIFSSYEKHIYSRQICIPVGVNMTSFLKSMAQGYKVTLDQFTIDLYQERFNHYASKESGLTFTSQALLYICKP